MVFGKHWMPENATVLSSGQVSKSVFSPSSATEQSEVFSDAYLRSVRLMGSQGAKKDGHADARHAVRRVRLGASGGTHGSSQTDLGGAAIQVPGSGKHARSTWTPLAGKSRSKSPRDHHRRHKGHGPAGRGSRQTRILGDVLVQPAIVEAARVGEGHAGADVIVRTVQRRTATQTQRSDPSNNIYPAGSMLSPATVTVNERESSSVQEVGDSSGKGPGHTSSQLQDEASHLDTSMLTGTHGAQTNTPNLNVTQREQERDEEEESQVTQSKMMYIGANMDDQIGSGAVSASDQQTMDQQRMMHSDSFGPLVFSPMSTGARGDPQVVTAKGLWSDFTATLKAGQPPSWAIQVNRFGFEPRVKKFSFTPIQRERLTAFEKIKKTFDGL